MMFLAETGGPSRRARCLLVSMNTWKHLDLEQADLVEGGTHGVCVWYSFRV